MLSATQDDSFRLPGAEPPFVLFTGNDHGVFRAAVETSPAATLVCDEAGAIVFCNRRSETLFGYTPGALVGRSVDVLVLNAFDTNSPSEPPVFGRQTKPWSGDGGRRCMGRRHDGSELQVDVSMASIARNGRRLRIITMIEVGRLSDIPEMGHLATTSVDTSTPCPSGDDRTSGKRPTIVVGTSQVVAESATVRRVLSQVEQVAPTNVSILLRGETGCGKEVFAQTIHDLSSRRRRPMVRVNCAAIPVGLLESELFGHERGAYTGALSQQIGKFELAEGSTIFLDEVGELSLEAQVKLLRVLQAKEVERLGGRGSIKVDVRVIAATNKDLERAIEERTFREDLYYRLSVFPICVPPLRDRLEDLPALIWTFVDDIATACGKQIDAISSSSLEALKRYAWPGNVRELRNAVERAVILAPGPLLTIEAPRRVLSRSTPALRLDDVESEHIQAVLEKSGWRIRGEGGAADLLGLKPTTLESRMVKLGIRRSA